MKTVTLNGTAINDEQSFHTEFQSALGFPAFYGRNMDALIDCLGYADDPTAGMCSVCVAPGEVLVLRIENAADFKLRCPALWHSFLESAAFVNWRRTERGQPAILSVSAYA